MLKVKTFKTNFSIHKNQKKKPLKKYKITMPINNFHSKQDHTFTKIYKFYNRITTRVLINNGRFRVVWCSQCKGGQNRKRCRSPVKFASNMQKDLVARKLKLTFIRILYIIRVATIYLM